VTKRLIRTASSLLSQTPLMFQLRSAYYPAEES